MFTVNLQKLGGRRFIATMGCGVATTLLCWFGKISDTVYATVTIATVAAFITGNVGETHILNRKPKPESTS